MHWVFQGGTLDDFLNNLMHTNGKVLSGNVGVEYSKNCSSFPKEGAIFTVLDYNTVDAANSLFVTASRINYSADFQRLPKLKASPYIYII